MKNGDKPAYPISEEATDRIDSGISIYTGLTKREYFAAMAMQGILANCFFAANPKPEHLIADDGSKHLKMGCYFRTLSEWESDFWNNTNEFPNDGSEKSKLRLMAFEWAKKWFELQDEIESK